MSSRALWARVSGSGAFRDLAAGEVGFLEFGARFGSWALYSPWPKAVKHDPLKCMSTKIHGVGIRTCCRGFRCRWGRGSRLRCTAVFSGRRGTPNGQPRTCHKARPYGWKCRSCRVEPLCARARPFYLLLVPVDDVPIIPNHYRPWTPLALQISH